MDAVDRGGEYLRCANPSWSDPLDGSYSMRFGGRWNAPGTFPVVYLSADRGTARANARHLLTKGFDAVFVSAEDLDPSELPTLVATEVPNDQYVDVVTDSGCVSAGLPTSYPYDATGQVIPHSACQPISLLRRRTIKTRALRLGAPLRDRRRRARSWRTSIGAAKS